MWHGRAKCSGPVRTRAHLDGRVQHGATLGHVARDSLVGGAAAALGVGGGHLWREGGVRSFGCLLATAAQGSRHVTAGSGDACSKDVHHFFCFLE